MSYGITITYSVLIFIYINIVTFKEALYCRKTMATLTGVVTKFYEEYTSSTPKKLKIVDAYLTYIFFTGVVQFVYCCLVGTFPFNAFLSGFISSVASFVLGVCLRLQV